MDADAFDGSALMPLDTPILKVSRPVAACSRCRNAKIKCDGLLPACSSCEKNGRAAECTSTNDQFARGKERSYVSTLETRLDRLQTKLEEARARKPSVISVLEDEGTETAVPSRRGSTEVREPSIIPTTSKTEKQRERSAIDALVSDLGFLSVNATARDFHGFTSAMSYARLILSACSKDQLPQGTTKALPPRHAATPLIRHYLDNVFLLLPVFEEASFYGSVEVVYGSNFRRAEPIDHWMVRMVLAIASASMSEQRGDQYYLEGIGHVCAALEHAEAVLHPGAISSLQALVLLTEYATLDPHHFDSWGLIGAASRAMVDLGLHQDPPKGTPMLRAKLELRRRVYHCIYALDRSTSLVQTRAFSFSDDSAKVKIPFAKASVSNPASPDGAGPQSTAWLQSYEQAFGLINLRQLQSAWYLEIFQSGRTAWDKPYQHLWGICDKMRQWWEHLSSSTSPSMRAFFELDLLYSYVYVLSISPKVPVLHPFAQKLIFEYCIRYADLMLHSISDPGYTPPLTFYDAMRVYMTGRQFLDVLQSNTDSLLHGFIPPHPMVQAHAAPPPPMPSVPPPPGETVQYFNTVRSIQCIKRTTECLARFGIRWGYMSWNSRYQNETAPMLEELNQRLRDLDEMAGRRRPNSWQHSSTGSIPSSNGSFSHQSPPSLPSLAPGTYGSSASIPDSHSSSLGAASQMQQISPPQYHQQPTFSYAHGGAVPAQAYLQGPPAFQNPFNLAQSYPVIHQPPYPTPPSQQFAGWHGYNGPSVPDMLDEENAAALATRRMMYPPGLDGEFRDTSGDALRAVTNSQADVGLPRLQEGIPQIEQPSSGPGSIPGQEMSMRRRKTVDKAGSKGKQPVETLIYEPEPMQEPTARDKGKQRAGLPPRTSHFSLPSWSRGATVQQDLAIFPSDIEKASRAVPLHQPQPLRAENMRPPLPEGASQPAPFSIPRSTIMPPLDGRGPAPLALQSDECTESLRPRRTSMQDAVIDLTSPTAIDASIAMQPRPGSPRIARSPRMTRRELGMRRIYDPSPLSQECFADDVDGFRFKPSIGYECEVCGMLVLRLDLHTSMGGRCIDYGSNILWDPQQPTSHSVVGQPSWGTNWDYMASMLDPAMYQGQRQMRPSLSGSLPVARDFAPDVFQWNKINRQ